MSKKLLSLPPNLVGCFHDITGLPASEYFCTNDPVGSRLGSGGGTAWVLQECRRSEGLDSMPMEEWLSRERRIIIHAGGQGRRMPAYAPSGKVLTPVPVFRWERGQKLSQTLLDLQLPLYERIIERAPKGLNTMVVSGDVYIRGGARLPKVPEADVVCYGPRLRRRRTTVSFTVPARIRRRYAACCRNRRLKSWRSCCRPAIS